MDSTLYRRGVAGLIAIILGIGALSTPVQVLAQVSYPEEQSQVAGAPGGAAHQPSFSEVLFKMMPMFLAVFVIFYFMVLKPQQKKLNDQKALVESLKKGDAVITTGGIIGRVAGIEADHVLVEVASNIRIKFEPNHIVRKAEKPASEKAAA